MKAQKNKLFALLLLASILTSCAQYPHFIKNGKEYVRLSQLNLTNKERFRIDWKTDYKSKWATIDPRYGGFIFDSSFNYDSLLIAK